VSARESPNGQPLLLVGNEISKTVGIFAIDVVATSPGSRRAAPASAPAAAFSRCCSAKAKEPHGA
jgi:hypothetical protein